MFTIAGILGVAVLVAAGVYFWHKYSVGKVVQADINNVVKKVETTVTNDVKSVETKANTVIADVKKV
jgi:sensor domain CHASE-containing protein